MNVEPTLGVELGGLPHLPPADPQRLLERGDLALQAIRYRRQAAEYAAAANELEQALVLARQGELESLHSWLAKQSGTLTAIQPDLVTGSNVLTEPRPNATTPTQASSNQASSKQASSKQASSNQASSKQESSNQASSKQASSNQATFPTQTPQARTPHEKSPHQKKEGVDGDQAQADTEGNQEPLSHDVTPIPTHRLPTPLGDPRTQDSLPSNPQTTPTQTTPTQTSPAQTSPAQSKSPRSTKGSSGSAQAKQSTTRPGKQPTAIPGQNSLPPETPGDPLVKPDSSDSLSSEMPTGEAADHATSELLSQAVNADGKASPVLRVLMGDSRHESKKPSRYSSALVSGLLHIALLIGFGAYTIKMIEEPKVMALTSSSMDSESISMVVETPMDLPPADEENDSFSMESQLAPATAEGLSGLVETGDGPVVEAPLMTAAWTSNATTTDSGMGQSLAKAEFFGVKAEGITFCYLVDKSPSMKRDRAFEMAVAELMRSLESLKPTQRYYIWFFSKELDALTLHGGEPEKFPVSATAENIQRTREWIQTIQIEGGAPPNDALTAAIEMDPDGIFLLFDGDTRVDVIKHLRKVNRVQDLLQGPVVRVPIHTVGFFTQEHESLMRGIADDNKGTYRFVPSPPKIKKPR